MCQRGRWRERRGERKRDCEAARESSNVNFPWTFLGVTIKPSVLLKLEWETCDWMVEEDGEAGAYREGGRGRAEAADTGIHFYIHILYNCKLNIVGEKKKCDAQFYYFLPFYRI